MVLVVRDQGDKYMPFGFDRRKSIQAVAVLLKTRLGNKDNYTRLLKILYIADRESLQETGSPITGDRFVAMENGTTLSRLYDLAKEKKASRLVGVTDHEQWATYFALEGEYYIRMILDPGDDALSEYDTKKLHDVSKRYQHHTWQNMRDVTHALPEYHNPGKSSKLISLKDFLHSVNMGAVAGHIESEARASDEFRRLMGR
jgi:uncharacterized phage-associated protein